jgi:signal transduction histidine kinase/ActR/RegA family two-component response regulator
VKTRSHHRSAEALADLGRLLSRTVEREVVAHRVGDSVRRLLGAQSTVVFQVERASGDVSVAAVVGGPALFEPGSVVEPGIGASGLAVRDRRTVTSTDVLDDPQIAVPDALRPRLQATGTRAVVAVPMMAGDRVIGVLTVLDAAGRVFGDDEVMLVQAFADQAALALENARLLEEAERRRGQAEAAERRAAFLDEAARVLSSSLDYETTLARVARLIVPEVGDVCAVDVLEDSGTMRRVAAVCLDPTDELSREFEARYSVDDDAAHGTLNVVRTGRSEFYPVVSEEVLATVARDGNHRDVLRALGVRSVMVVPLQARGRTLGALTLATARSGRLYTSADLQLAEELARRAAQAIDNAGLYREAQEANRAKDEFLATVSHELRTPLTAILGWSRVLRGRDTADETASRALESIERNARALAEIVDDLLDVSRIISGKLRLSIGPLDLVTVITEAIDAVRPAIDAKGIVLTTALQREAGAFVGDADRLQQVVWNLLSNSVKFTPPGGRVEVVLRGEGAHAEIVVRDTGRGIRPELLPHVFERFRQGDSTTSRAHSGLGLGLAIVRHIVELHGGIVQAESAGEGAGALFTVRLPVAPALREDGETGASRGPRRPAVSRATRALLGVSVLVVDDEADARQLMQAILEGAGARVRVAASVAEAEADLAHSRPDVLVCDIGMPGEDGFALIGRLRAVEQGTRLPAVALTAYARREDRDRALGAGFDLHVPKPVEPSDLVKTVAGLVRRGKAA